MSANSVASTTLEVLRSSGHKYVQGHHQHARGDSVRFSLPAEGDLGLAGPHRKTESLSHASQAIPRTPIELHASAFTNALHRRMTSADLEKGPSSSFVDMPLHDDAASDVRSFITINSLNTVNSASPLRGDDGRPPPSLSAGSSESMWQGWRIVLFGSYLNILLLLIPVSWTLGFVMSDSYTVVFVLCILSLIPLVRLHDLSSRELALRIGGNKTGLLNASMSNIVELVIAITALRKCELKVVQSALIGSILSKLLLVLGLCFFAGGLKFSSQAFDSTATQIHSSLLSISVGALLLPAAYHFALTGTRDGSLINQGEQIIKMSHAVAIVLIFIYVAYLFFQLWSHTHLYKDQKKKSEKLRVEVPTAPVYLTEKIRQARAKGSSLSLSGSRSSSYGSMPPMGLSTEELIKQARMGADDAMSTRSSTPSISPSEMRPSSYFPGATSHTDTMNASSGLVPSDSTKSIPPEPRLSWMLTVVVMMLVTVMVAVTAENLIESLDALSDNSAISKEWIGLVLLPAVSAIAECVTAINVSVKDQLTLSLSVAVGSSIQLTLLIIPSTVILGWIMNRPLALLFDPFESVVLYIAVQISNHVLGDGESNWLEGLILVCLYVIIAVSFWYYPGSDFTTLLGECPGK
ncbi:hypothetical protein CONPUDRAFT_163528 [Coniophora puteana RWD-64-598 SS2]|uniref:Sodium/calcium exchanger membrane region domain-containing protein n=1 Tax=Coniophora puteana (strain RWD-64-598) TaxID=741705 RepID=A0A5M3N001_CONPW|nr:uncharacterized protein CONPUDRAFT_163528 [Coniophora puteana RWD-64-598 SS2]EIW84384.1 hypothetical protein CONPUDRAFT_163528 [Coniophora puteana RWD-64-598 SS2]